MRIRSLLLAAASLCLATPLLAVTTPGAPAYARPAAAAGAAAKTGCQVQAGFEACFTSPLAVPRDPTVLDRPSRLFDTAGPGDTIRIAMFRWDIEPPTDAILAAQRRGATVLLGGDDDLRLNKQGRRLIATLEEQDPARRNVTI